MHRGHFWHGTGIVRATAISGIDIALWDLLGKVHGVPCHRLWGGPVRDHVRLYGHLGEGEMVAFYEPGDATHFAERAQAMVEAGFTAFKAMAVPATAPIEGLGPLRYAERCVGAMREAVGEDIDIMVDCHARPSPRMGHRFAQALEPFGLYWLEEPCWAGAAARPRGHPAQRLDAHRHGRAADEPAGLRRAARRSAAPASCSPTSRTAAG